MKLLGIAGSLRKGSYNRGLLRAAGELCRRASSSSSSTSAACRSTTATSRLPAIPSPSWR
jgi:NAD(P)H-dependent FMN reductase